MSSPSWVGRPVGVRRRYPRLPGTNGGRYDGPVGSTRVDFSVLPTISRRSVEPSHVPRSGCSGPFRSTSQLSPVRDRVRCSCRRGRHAGHSRGGVSGSTRPTTVDGPSYAGAQPAPRARPRQRGHHPGARPQRAGGGDRRRAWLRAVLGAHQVPGRGPAGPRGARPDQGRHRRAPRRTAPSSSSVSTASPRSWPRPPPATPPCSPCSPRTPSCPTRPRRSSAS